MCNLAISEKWRLNKNQGNKVELFIFAENTGSWAVLHINEPSAMLQFWNMQQPIIGCRFNVSPFYILTSAKGFPPTDATSCSAVRNYGMVSMHEINIFKIYLKTK